MSREKVLCGKEEIIRVAIGIVDRQGVESLSIRNIAKELGVSPMTIYNYVENLQDIKKRVLINGFDRLYASVYDELSELPSPVDKLLFCKTIAMSIYRFGIGNSNIYTYMFGEGQKTFSEDAEVRPLYQNVQKLMKRAKATQHDLSTNETGYSLFEMIVFSVTYQISAGTNSITEAGYEELIDFYLDKCVK